MNTNFISLFVYDKNKDLLRCLAPVMFQHKKNKLVSLSKNLGQT